MRATRLLSLVGLVSLMGSAPNAYSDTVDPAAPATCETLGFAPKTAHETILLGGQSIPYTITGSFTPVLQADGTLGACVYSTRYTRDDATDLSKRPLTFLFNGGPGESSALVHFGGLGPQRLDFGAEGTDFTKGSALTENPNTFLSFSDLVFVDPVGTGYTVMAPGVDISVFQGGIADAKLFSDFIYTNLSLLGRASSPLFIVGESYGGIRAPIAANDLATDHSVIVNGLILISPALDYRNLDAQMGNNQEYITALPADIMAGWYYKMSTPAMQGLDLEHAYKKAKTFADTTYAAGLFAGDSLTPAKLAKIQSEVALLTGNSHIVWGTDQVVGDDYEFVPGPVLKYDGASPTLLKDQGLILSYYDLRVSDTQADLDAHPDASIPDPLFVRMGSSMTDAEAAYFSQTLGIPASLKYADSYSPMSWPFPQDTAYPESTTYLQTLMQAHPAVKVYIASGVFDDSCTTNSVEYSVDQLIPEVAARVSISRYPSGHMVYLGQENATRLGQEVGAFVASQSGVAR